MMKKNIIFILVFLFLSANVFAAGSNDTSAKEDNYKKGYMKKANDFDVSNCTTKNIGSILKNLGFPLVLTFESAPKRGDESVRQAVLLKKVQRKFRAHLERKKRRSALIRKNEDTPLPLPLPRRPGTAPPPPGRKS